MEDLINLTKQVWTTYLGSDRAKVIELLNIIHTFILMGTNFKLNSFTKNR